MFTARAARSGSSAASAALTEVLRLAGQLATERGDLGAARARFEDALAVAEAADDPLRAALAVNTLGVTAYAAGDLDRAGPLLEEALRRRRALGHPGGVATSLSDLGHLAVLRGDLAAARVRYEESLALRRTHGDPSSLATATRCLGYAVALQGDHHRARTLLEEGAAHARAGGGPPGALPWTLVLLGDARAALGDVVAARAALVEALALCRDPTDGRHEAQAARVAVAVLGIARLAAAEGQPGRALRLAGAATAVLDAAPRMPFHAWQTADWRRQAEHDLAALRTTLGPATTWAAGRAMPLDEAVVEALALPPPATGGTPEASPPAPPGVPGGLTAREREVAVLVAQGHSNPQVAAALVIAPRTAARHVEHIMAKLGVHSRAEVAAWAAQQGLLRSGGT